MLSRNLISIIVIALFALVSACSNDPVEVGIDINATFNGKPVADANVIIDEQNAGVTDAHGRFNTIIMRKEDTTINLKVEKVVEGYRVNNWSNQVNFNDQSGDKFSMLADLTGTPFITFKAVDGKSPVKGAKIKLGKDVIGKTDDNGELVYDLPEVNDKKVSVSLSKYGFDTFSKKLSFTPGETISAAMPRQLLLRVEVKSEKLNEEVNVKNAEVYLGNKLLGKTDQNGLFRVVQSGKKGKKEQLTVKAPGYLPESWSTTVNLEGEVKHSHYFYPVKQDPIRVALFRFVSNTAGEDIGTIPTRFQKEIESRVKQMNGFNLVDNDTLMDLFTKSKLSPEDLTTKGWEKTNIFNEVDVIGFGSVTKDLKGKFIVETKFYTADGQVAFSQIATAKNGDNIDRAAKEIMINMKESYPIVGRVVKDSGNEYRINLGNDQFPIEDKNEFVVYNPSFDEIGKITGYKEVGGIKVTNDKDDYSVAEINGMKAGVKPLVGARVIRTNMLDDNNKQFVTILAKSDIRGNIQPLQGVNVYVDEKWVGATGRDGKAKISVRLNKEYKVSMYRHGFSQKTVELEVEKNAELKEFMLDSYYSLLKVTSDPSNATVYIDGSSIGTTPLTEGKPVSTGFHTVRIAAGGDWRDFEEVIEFSANEVNWTGDQSIMFHKDYLRLGDKAAAAGRVDEAIALYQKAEKDHPDYADIHHNLAQLYLDEKKDPTAAVAEFEKVVAIPEVRELIYKHFSIAYTNLGHAYHAQADKVLHTDSKEAAQLLAKSIQTLNKAKENSRFFPNDFYDVAVHDTYYYIALSYQKLYQLSKKSSIMTKAELAWRDYLDFFPEKLANNPDYVASRESVDTFMEQLKGN
ncbi:MAG: PEGA domain-containing protein [Gammaproteobacteria bacterium]|nr:PEGA domain-containing protein [Gammaproteobacteria bacterium]